MSWLNDSNSLSESEIKSYYSYVMNFNRKKAFISSLKVLCVVNVLMLILFFTTHLQFVLYADVLVSFMTLINPDMTYKKRFKALRNEIYLAYPKWLMSLALLLQTDSIRVSIVKSVEKAPFVMIPELNKLVNEIKKDDSRQNVTPYLNFMRFFDIPEITTSMQMLYALSRGVSGSLQEQIDNILEQNSELLNKSIKIAKENELAAFELLFSLPNATGSLKLVVDMIVFFITFMNSMNNAIVF